jgi:ubiquinone/menaquinone biosynthesis C-methylase UbiE
MDHRKIFFDSVASNWDKDYVDKDRRKDLDFLIAKFGINRTDKVLDLGCGTGIITREILEIVKQDGKIIGCDFSLSMLSNSSLNKRNFVCCDVYNLPFKDSYFDKVIFFSCFPHFDRRETVIKETERVLKKRGMVFVCHLLSSRQIEEVHSCTDVSVSKDTMPSEKKMIRLFEDCGMAVYDFQDKEGFYFLSARK